MAMLGIHVLDLISNLLSLRRCSYVDKDEWGVLAIPWL
jgi:hypothetical protein